MNNLILVGGGGHCRSVIDVAECAGYNILGILDRPEEVGKHVLGYEVIGIDNDMAKFADKADFIVTVGQIKSPNLRIKLYQMLDEAHCHLATVIAPTAHVSNHAVIGEGTVVMHNAVINANASVGKGCIINTLSDIEHDVRIGDYCHISTGAMVNGGAIIGNGSFVGSQSVIYQGIQIGEKAVIGAQTAVVKDVAQYNTVIGVPSRVIKNSNEVVDKQSDKNVMGGGKSLIVSYMPHPVGCKNVA